MVGWQRLTPCQRPNVVPEIHQTFTQLNVVDRSHGKMKKLAVIITTLIILSVGAEEVKPPIPRRISEFGGSINEYTFTFEILKNGMIRHHDVEFTHKQFGALARSLFHARPSARMVFSAEDGGSYSMDEPPISTVKEIGFTDWVAVENFKGQTICSPLNIIGLTIRPYSAAA